MNASIVTPFEEALKEAGFSKKSGSWYFDKDETVLVANLQKSNYGDQYYVNLAIWLKAIGETQFPKEHKCHIRLRLDSLVGEKAVKCFDGEEPITSAKRASLIKSLMENKGIPFLTDCGTLKGIGRQMALGSFDDALVSFEVEQLVSGTG